MFVFLIGRRFSGNIYFTTSSLNCRFEDTLRSYTMLAPTAGVTGSSYGFSQVCTVASWEPLMHHGKLHLGFVLELVDYVDFNNVCVL